jgi:hypothetical protein
LSDDPPEPKATAPDEPREITLFLKDGRRFTGDLIEQSETQYIIAIGGVRTRFLADDVERIILHPPLMERYHALREGINENDWEQVQRLTRWLEERKQLDLAMGETLGFLKRNPGHRTAQSQLDRLRRQLSLRAPSAKPDASAPRKPAPSDEKPESDQFPVLTPAQINLMKVYEVDLTRPPALVVPREALQSAFEKYAGHPLVPAAKEARDAILRDTPEKKLDLLFRLKARELYPRVQVLDTPESIRQYRGEVWLPLVHNACATSQCHGGTEAGRFMLPFKAPNSDASVMTSLYILERFRTSDGKPLIDWDHPEQSALLQLALPRDVATIKHPPVVRGEAKKDIWRSPLRSTDERRYKDTINWIKSMYQPRPDYGIDYEPPKPLAPPAPVQNPSSER